MTNKEKLEVLDKYLVDPDDWYFAREVKNGEFIWIDKEGNEYEYVA